ncbi:conserved hypothetical protein [delta proteobacterium NaphS2]|nr:conserved hypothetical protein [delta proteobacterium NaphS2]
MTLFFEKELHNALFQELSMPRLYEKRISSYTDIGPFNSNRELLCDNQFCLAGNGQFN